MMRMNENFLLSAAENAPRIKGDVSVLGQTVVNDLSILQTPHP
ncbi:MAG: hypothetical protein RSC58_09555 [Ruthenibacterium sp.]